MHSIATPKPHYTLDVYECDEPVEHETYRVDENDYGQRAAEARDMAARREAFNRCVKESR